MIKIRKILLPDTIAGRRLFSEKSLGISINENSIKAAIIKNNGSRKTIEKLIELEYPDATILDNEGNVNEAELTVAFSKIQKQAGTIDKISLSLPANLFTFKEIEMPFAETEKIKMVLNYEAEPLIPFPAGSYALDFIQNQNSSGPCKILACAIQKSALASLKNTLTKVGLIPDNLTIDLVNIYDLCNQLEPGQKHESNYAIVSISSHWTKIGFVDRGLLRFVKNIPTGTTTIVQELKQHCNLNEVEIKKIVSGELDSISADQEVQKHFHRIILELNKKLNFVLQSFNSKSDSSSSVEKILFLEDSFPVPAFSKLCQQLTNIPCLHFSVEKMLATDKIVNRASLLSSSIYSSLTAIATASNSNQLEDFDMGQGEISRSKLELITQQLIASCCITFLIFFYIFFVAYIKNNQVENSILQVEESIRNKVTKNLLPVDAKLPKRPTIKKLLEEAENYSSGIKKSWKKHGQSDLIPLEVMLDFTRLLEPTKMNIKVTSLKLLYNPEAQKILELKGNFKKGDTDKEFKRLVSQIGSIKKYTNIKVTEERQPDMVQFTIQAEMET